jgi:hypothetical protein
MIFFIYYDFFGWEGEAYLSIQRQNPHLSLKGAWGATTVVGSSCFFLSFFLFYVSFFLLFFSFSISFSFLFFIHNCLFCFSSCFSFTYISFLILLFVSFFLSFFLLFLFYFLFHFYLSFLFIYSTFNFFVYVSIFYIFFLIFSQTLIFLLFEMRCKFILARIISCSGYKYLVWAIITTCSDPCFDMF